MRKKGSFLKFILLLGDIFLMYSALLFTLAVRQGDFSFLPGFQTRVFVFHFSIFYIFWILFLFALDFYEIPPFRKISAFLSNLIIFALLAGASGVIYFYLQPQLVFTPKTILFLDVLIFSLLFLAWRSLVNYLLKLRNFKERVGIIGFRSELKKLTPGFLSHQGYEISVFFVPNLPLFDKSLDSISCPVVSNIYQLKEIIGREKVSLIVIALDFHKDEKLAQEIFSNLPLKLNYITFAEFYESLTKKVPIEALNEIWFLENLSRAEKKIDNVVKRIFDLCFSFLGFLITVVLFPFIALAIKIDSSGSVLYSQKRMGKEGKEFTLYKFRTMKEASDQDKKVWREKEAGQVTRVGKVLRRTHLDEFPQFWSILKGDLSFVGPRPEWVQLAKVFEKEISFYSQRYLIKPGFTGWAQLNFPASSSIEEAKQKFEYDLYYLKNRSFFLDMEIILKTIRIVFK